MRKIVHVCDLHPSEVAELVRFKFFLPDTGLTYEVDCCPTCASPIRDAVKAFVEHEGVETVTGERLPDADGELPPGYFWWAATSSKSSSRLAHATNDKRKSRCNLVVSPERWAGPATADEKRCSKCVSIIAGDLKAAKSGGK